MINHPCQFSPEVLTVIQDFILPGEHVHDPFAGPGVRLGALCDRLGATFSGGDIEEWPGRDPRVRTVDALSSHSYPAGDFLLVTSPVYVNKRCADYRNGPTPATKTKGRRDYGIALGRALDCRNLARHTGRRAETETYWLLHERAAAWWPRRVIVNVDEPIAERWLHVLNGCGYVVEEVIPAFTRRYGGLANADKRAEYEVVIRARRPGVEKPPVQIAGQLSLLG